MRLVWELSRAAIDDNAEAHGGGGKGGKGGRDIWRCVLVSMALCVSEHEFRACGGGRLCRRRAQGPFEVNGQRRRALAKIKGPRGLIYTRQLALNYTPCASPYSTARLLCV